MSRMTAADAPTHQSTLLHKTNALRRRLEFGDALLFLYFVAFVRQFIWYVAEGAAAWALTLPLALTLWFCYVAARPEEKEETPRSFWLIVVLPLLFVYALRLPFPDLSFDVLNYRLLHAERALRGFLFLPGDFFPTPAPYNPAPDMVTGISRHLLGYRMGTLVNLLALVWTGLILEKLLRPSLKDTRLRSLGVLFVLFTEHVLFEINNYMIDVLTLPLLLEATRMALDVGESDSAPTGDGEEHARDYEEQARDESEGARDERERGRDAVRFAFLLGASVAFKLTSLAFAVPLALVYAYKLFASRRRLPLRAYLFAVSAFAAPLLPFCIYIYRQTGSPVYPLYNAVFKSPYWPYTNVLDPRWGSDNFFEILFWPVVLLFRVERTAEILVYSGRISLGFVAALACLVFARTQRRILTLSFITLVGSLLWSTGSGYVRYALYLELTGGLVVVCLSHHLWTRRASLSRSARLLAAIAASLFVCLLVVQCVLAGLYILRYEWSMRPTLLGMPRAYLEEAKHLFRDRELRDFLSTRERELFDEVGVWAESSVKMNGIEVMLKKDAPIVAVRMGEFFIEQESRERFARALAESRGRRMFSLAFGEELASAQRSIEERGLRVGKVVPIALSYYSSRTKLNVVLIEVLPEGAQVPEAVAQKAPRNSALPDEAFRAQLSVADAPATMRAGEQSTIYVVLKNRSETIWPGAQESWKYQLTIGNRWLDARDRALVTDLDARTALVRDLPPGEEAELPLSISAPAKPGEYILELDAVQEGVAWFRDKGSQALELRVRVE
ncbi:MAG TPA: hypothetical protein VGB73_03735 [Pyrinomonadaceae bacterium]